MPLGPRTAVRRQGGTVARRLFVPGLAFVVGVLLASGPWLTAQHAPALSTQDYIDIQQLYARYYTAIDSGKGEAWADTFVPDGVFNELKGHDALVNLVNDYYRNG